MANSNVENSSYGTFERFLFYFLPILFTLILSGVLLSVFGYDVVNNGLKAAHKIPIVGTFLPLPKATPSDPTKTATGSTDSGNPADFQNVIKDLKSKIASQDADLQKSVLTMQQKDQAIKDMQDKQTSLEAQLKDKTLTDEEYDKQVQNLADLYSKMSPSKAAPILESLAPNELILVLSKMKQTDLVNVLEKMTAKTAADATIQLKDIVKAKDLELAALQDRLDIYKKTDPKIGKSVSISNLGQTFANMTAKSAATVLQEMMKANQTKVIDILASMDVQSRSKIMTALSDLSKTDAAKISAKLTN